MNTKVQAAVRPQSRHKCQFEFQQRTLDALQGAPLTTLGVRLIAIVIRAAVMVAVAHPGLGHAAPGRVTSDVALRTRGVTTVGRLVTRVSAVIVVVTAPHEGHTAFVGAGELVLRAFDDGW